MALSGADWRQVLAKEALEAIQTDLPQAHNDLWNFFQHLHAVLSASDMLKMAIEYRVRWNRIALTIQNWLVTLHKPVKNTDVAAEDLIEKAKAALMLYGQDIDKSLVYLLAKDWVKPKVTAGVPLESQESLEKAVKASAQMTIAGIYSDYARARHFFETNLAELQKCDKSNTSASAQSSLLL